MEDMKLISSQASDLSDDLIVEIIRKLPVKDLVCFMSINTFWYDFITSSSFIKSTISNTSHNNRYLLHTDNSNYRDEFLICTHDDDDNCCLKDSVEGDEDELIVPDKINKGKYYYTAESFGKRYNGFITTCSVKVYGICNGLLCVSDYKMEDSSNIYLWNPVIRKIKDISVIRTSIIRPAQIFEPVEGIDLCFGYFRDDYKVIRMGFFCGSKKCSIGVYSLSTDAWKIICCDSNYASLDGFGNFLDNRFVNRIVNGVVYFVNYESRIICFDLHRERIREVQFPDKFDQDFCYYVEPYGESVALVQIREDNLIMWVLRNCAGTSSSTWEKKVTIKLETKYIYPLGFTKHGKYLLEDDEDLGTKYLWDFGISQLEKCTSDMEAEDYLVGNLVLLDEKKFDPFVETEPCSTQTIFVLHTSPSQRVTDMLDMTRNRMQGRKTSRTIEQTDIENTRKKVGKEKLDNTPNRLQGRGTKRRKEDTEMEKPRKKEKEMLDKMQNVLHGRRAKRIMEETEIGKPRKKGKKEGLSNTQNIFQGWGAKRRKN